MSLELIAFIAAAFGVSSSLPQIYKILKTKDTLCLSYGTYVMVCISGMIWISYGLIAPVYSIVLWNSVSVMLSLSILALKMNNERPAFWLSCTLYVRQPICIRCLSMAVMTTGGILVPL